MSALNRRSFLTASVAALTGCASAPRADAFRKPNIIYILADDLGYGDLGCYGQTKIETPNIDRLRAAGMLFTTHYSGSPVCAPSRCVLLTGKHTGHAYILYWEYPEAGGSQAVRMGRWKALRSNLRKGTPTTALYDLDADFRETTDVADRYPNVTAQLERIMRDARVPPALETFKLQALGD